MRTYYIATLEFGSKTVREVVTGHNIDEALAEAKKYAETCYEEGPCESIKLYDLPQVLKEDVLDDPEVVEAIRQALYAMLGQVPAIAVERLLSPRAHAA